MLGSKAVRRQRPSWTARAMFHRGSGMTDLPMQGRAPGSTRNQGPRRIASHLRNDRADASATRRRGRSVEDDHLTIVPAGQPSRAALRRPVVRRRAQARGVVVRVIAPLTEKGAVARLRQVASVAAVHLPVDAAGHAGMTIVDSRADRAPAETSVASDGARRSAGSAREATTGAAHRDKALAEAGQATKDDPSSAAIHPAVRTMAIQAVNVATFVAVSAAQVTRVDVARVASAATFAAVSEVVARAARADVPGASAATPIAAVVAAGGTTSADRRRAGGATTMRPRLTETFAKISIRATGRADPLMIAAVDVQQARRAADGQARAAVSGPPAIAPAAAGSDRRLQAGAPDRSAAAHSATIRRAPAASRPVVHLPVPDRSAVRLPVLDHSAVHPPVLDRSAVRPAGRQTGRVAMRTSKRFPRRPIPNPLSA